MKIPRNTFFMIKNGIPFTRVLKLKYKCKNEYLVESKSLKLYLNSFNMTRFGKTIQEALNICKDLIQKDLSEKLETEVELNFLENSSKRFEIFENFKKLMDFAEETSFNVESFKEAPELLRVSEAKEKEYFLTFAEIYYFF